MAPAAKRRKVSAAPAEQQGIARFGRISKARIEPPSKKASKETVHNEAGIQELDVLDAEREESRLVKPENKTTTGIKRSYRLASNDLTPAPSPQLPRAISIPITPRKKAASKSRIIETPTKGTRSCLESLLLSNSSSPSRSIESPRSVHTETPLTSPVSPQSPRSTEQKNYGHLPDELLDLKDLHSAFLTALSLHYAHNGSFTPADLRLLRPSTARSWGKRNVEIDDLRRALAIQDLERVGEGLPKDSREYRAQLILTDHGNSKICVEISDASRQDVDQRRPIQVETLRQRFSKNLTTLWDDHLAFDQQCTNPIAFISKLPLAPLKSTPSTSKASPLLQKGQTRLTDLKAGAVKAQKHSLKPTSISLFSSPSTSVTAKVLPASRTSSLHSRILAKQLHQSTLAPLPSPEVLSRKSALHRIEEILPILESLASSSSNSSFANSHINNEIDPRNGSRVSSFTMPTIVQHLQMSLKNPIAKDEAVRCVRLLAGEVVPEMVGIREVGRLVGVTIRKGVGLGREEIRGKIKKALDGS